MHQRSRQPFPRLLAASVALAVLVPAAAEAQGGGFATGLPGRDPAGEDAIGWGPAYRPETSFSQPGTPPTPGDYAGAAYRARTGRGVYDRPVHDRQVHDRQVHDRVHGRGERAPRLRRHRDW